MGQVQVRTAHVVSSQQKAVLRIVRNLTILNGGVLALIGIHAWSHAMSWGESIPLLLTSVLASIPVSLPATFTLAAVPGARALAKAGILPTRLTALDEAASSRLAAQTDQFKTQGIGLPFHTKGSTHTFVQ